MNKDTARDYLPLVQALAEGKVIQHRFFEHETWKDTVNPDFTMYPSNYRIKPEPREVWVIESVDGSQNGPFISEFEANTFCRKGYEVIRYREVIE